MNNHIPISDAEKISSERNYDMVIIVGIQGDGSGHITTYGKNKLMCKIAGDIGQNKVASILFNQKGEK